tara:strand:+ start:323 stop:790 length:468 start_codon:yes stop_codon:yes gene_type:complete
MSKGNFNDKISAEFTPPKTWELERVLSFKTHLLTKADIDLLKEVGANIAATGRISCKKGMKTDLASVPRIVWALISPWDVARAAVIHDHLYATLRDYYHSSGMSKDKWRDARKLSDEIFLLGMQSAEPSVWKIKIWAAYWSVRVFGRWPASAKQK